MKISGLFGRIALIGLSLALPVFLANAAPQPGKGQITALRGTVSLDGKPAQVGDVAGPGATITTGASSQVELDLGANGPSVSIQENGSVSFDELTVDDSGPAKVAQTKINLKKGKIAGRVKRTSPKSTFQIVTPTATASVRGTIYEITAEGYVYVWEGAVDVVFSGITYTVTSGKAFDPIAGAVVSNPYPNAPVTATTTDPSNPVGPVIILSPTKPGSPAVPTAPKPN